MTEPHRFTSILTCLAGMTRQIVRQTPDFSHGQTFVLPLLMSVLPGIDSNDFKKTSVTFQFLNAMLMLITCVDCSSAIHTRNDLSEVKINSGRKKKLFYFCIHRLKKKFVYQQLNSKILLVNFLIEYFK
jgi:hypothetical protein